MNTRTIPDVAPDVAIVGGGLAGLAAGVNLSKQGFKVTLLEKRPFLGGRAFSFVDPETGVEIDNGQHVFVGANTNYIRFLREIGAWEHVRMPNRLSTRVILDGKSEWLRASSWIPGSAGNLPAILRYGHISRRGRLRLLYGLARIKFTRRRAGSPLENETFDSWLRRHGQTDETVSRFWNLIILPALNDDIADVSADAGIMLFQEALLKDPSKGAIGYPTVGLSKLTGGSSSGYIADNGGEVKLSADVARIAMSEERATGVYLETGELIEARSIVLALPAAEMLKLVSDNVGQADFFAPASGIETAPIVGVHIWYDRQVLEELFVAVLDSPLQWVFNVNKMHEEEPDESANGQHIVISLSGAWQWKDRSKTELREIFTTEMARVFPEAANADVTRFVTVKMLDATFRVTPGAEAHRLPQETPINGLFLAGDWTRTGLQSTMESAVLSGNLAADAASQYLSN